jgi:hypothetical protein
MTPLDDLLRRFNLNAKVYIGEEKVRGTVKGVSILGPTEAYDDSPQFVVELDEPILNTKVGTIRLILAHPDSLTLKEDVHE